MLSPTAVPSHPNAPGDLGDHNLPPAHSSSAPEYFLHATQRLNERSRWAMVWMVGFAMLVIATVVHWPGTWTISSKKKNCAAGVPMPSGWSKACCFTFAAWKTTWPA